MLAFHQHRDYQRAMEPNYFNISPGTSPPRIKEVPSKAILICEPSVSDVWRELVCNWLVEIGCVYVCTWGPECQRWHDSVDDANLSRFDYQDIPDDHFIMTSWHEREPFSEAMWFFVHAAFHPSVEFKRALVVHISAVACEAEYLEAYRLAQLDD